MNDFRFLLLSTMLIVSSYCFSQKQAEIVWKEKVHDFKQISSKDSLVSIIFPFTVKGEEAVVIYEASASCGCTKAEWTKYPIISGKEGFVRVYLRTVDLRGYFDKRIIVKSNAKKNLDLLRIKGYIK